MRISNYTPPTHTRIFRHMRLSSGFLNEERTATGIQKLRIPTTLLREKMRTARRFMVHPILCANSVDLRKRMH